ncbi:MAG: hypothetical protein ACAI44_13280 [Candidatus Sericytochromatia bacterium]
MSPHAPKPNPADLLLPSFDALIPGGTDTSGLAPSPVPSASAGVGLLASLSQLGIHLSTEEITQLRNLTEVQPNGRWSRSQSQTAEQNLLANYKRFSPLFNPSLDSAEEYRLRAVTFAEKATVPYYLDLQYYLDTKRLLVAKWNEESGEFVVVQSDGSLVNYLITHAIQPPRYLKVEL